MDEELTPQPDLAVAEGPEPRVFRQPLQGGNVAPALGERLEAIYAEIRETNRLLRKLVNPPAGSFNVPKAKPGREDEDIRPFVKPLLLEGIPPDQKVTVST